METNISPFYEAYSKQAENIKATLDISIKESAAKMGTLVNKIYSIEGQGLGEGWEE